MTIADLAAALRGVPRDSRVLIDTPDGLRELRSVKPVYTRQGPDGDVEVTVSGDYAIVLYPEGRMP